MATKTDLKFETSNSLKKAFNEHFQFWSKKHRLSTGDLAARCGVSTQYLSHVGRYGRIPSLPVLILLTLNLEIPDPEAFFRLANISEPWPLDANVALRAKSASDSGLLSINLDMQGFTQAIKEIVRGELRPRSLSDLLNGRPLKVGINLGQSFFFTAENKKHEGFFPELMRLIALGLQCEVDFVEVSHMNFAAELDAGKIDCYGPIYFTPHRLSQALFSNPFASVHLGAVSRIKPLPNLAGLPAPKKLSDLRKHPYLIAFHKDSMSHHFATEELQIPSDRLIPCETSEESIERIIMSKIPRPAHLLLTDLPHALLIQKEHASQTALSFTEFENEPVRFEDALAVRKDWPTVLQLVNETLELLKRNGAISRIYKRYIEEKSIDGVDI